MYLHSPRPLTDLARQCDWLSRNVSGTAQQVAGAIGVGELLTVLGVDFQAQNGRIEYRGSDHGHHAYEDAPPDLDLDHEKGDGP